MLGSVREMKKWAYEIHSTFIVKDAPLDIKLDEVIVETIENMLKVCSLYIYQWVQCDLLRFYFRRISSKFVTKLCISSVS